MAGSILTGVIGGIVGAAAAVLANAGLFGVALAFWLAGTVAFAVAACVAVTHALVLARRAHPRMSGPV